MVAAVAVQAGALGLFVHQMAGFDRSKAGEVFSLPEGYDPMTVIAIGYPGDPDTLPDGLGERELAARTRKPQAEFVFNGAWKEPLAVEKQPQI